MKKHLLTTLFVFSILVSNAQQVGILRKNYFSTYFDSILNTNIQVLDSSTIRLGSIQPTTGVISNLGVGEYKLSVNLNGATINPYLNHYYIGSGNNLLTFDMGNGALLNNVPITGPLVTSSFQNLRFNSSDSLIYGLVPENFYSTYFDSISMSNVTVLDSSKIRFGTLNPQSGNYSLIGNSSFNNMYTLAGNSIDPYQMIYYYSAVDSLVGIDLYTGAKYSEVPIQLPTGAIFENIAYSCADTSIYGITRQNHTSFVFDSLIMQPVEVVDSTTFRLSKINPTTGQITFVSGANLGVGGNLTGGSFIDPNAMIYYLSHNGQLIGISLQTGQIVSAANKTFPSGTFAFDMMRSAQNCYGAMKIRNTVVTSLSKPLTNFTKIELFPNPAKEMLTVQSTSPVLSIQLLDANGRLVIETKANTVSMSNLPVGLYLAKITTADGGMYTEKVIKN